MNIVHVFKKNLKNLIILSVSYSYHTKEMNHISLYCIEENLLSVIRILKDLNI